MNFESALSILGVRDVLNLAALDSRYASLRAESVAAGDVAATSLLDDAFTVASRYHWDVIQAEAQAAMQTSRQHEDEQLRTELAAQGWPKAWGVHQAALWVANGGTIDAARTWAEHDWPSTGVLSYQGDLRLFEADGVIGTMGLPRNPINGPLPGGSGAAWAGAGVDNLSWVYLFERDGVGPGVVERLTPEVTLACHQTDTDVNRLVEIVDLGFGSADAFRFVRAGIGCENLDGWDPEEAVSLYNLLEYHGENLLEYHGELELFAGLLDTGSLESAHDEYGTDPESIEPFYGFPPSVPKDSRPKSRPRREQD